ncbi:MAG: hypothetical protein JOZ71_07450 [Ktedonobacteraceae bacterium]|nr:hypothetical protein [Ktedonobacteraceae bacterium]
MAKNNYHFITHWHVEGKLEDVTDIIGDARRLARWWPAVYLDVRVLKEGEKSGLGWVVDLYTKGWLPYTMHWHLEVTEVCADGFTLVAHGDFEGRGIWTFTQEGPWVHAIYDWKVSAEKPLMRYFSFIMKPLFSANHHWAMAKGEQSLKLELARRAATTAEERARIPAPPQPTTTSSVPLLLATVGALVVVGSVGYFVGKWFSETV